MQRPLISIVICCYNRADMLPTTLDSVFAQQYRPVEIIVLDDGSTDATADLMAGYRDRLTYHVQPNQGVAHARTNAARLARGEFIAFQDDDDLMTPDRLDLLYDALVAHPECSFAVGNLEVIGEHDRIADLLASRPASTGTPHLTIHQDGFEAVLWPRVSATNHTTLFRRRDGERINWFDARYTIGGEDKDFFARLGKLGPVVHVDRTVSFYRRGHTSLTHRQQISYFAALRLFENHLRALSNDAYPMRERLRQRILITLKAMTTLRHRGVPIPAEIPKDFARDALSFLNGNQRLAYYFRSLVTAPLAGFLKRHV